MLNTARSSRLLTWFGLFGCVVTSVILPLGFGALAPYIIDDLDISAVRFGSLASGYFLGAALFSRAAGRLVGKIGGGPGLVIFLGSQIVTLLLLAFVARTFAFTLMLAVANGIGAAGVTPAVNRHISSLSHARGLVVGIGQSGIPAAALAGGAGLAPLAARIGWRPTIGISAAAGALFLLLAHAEPAPRPQERQSPESHPQAHGPMRLSIRKLVLLTLLMAFAQSPFYLYGVLYMSHSLDFEAVDAARIFGVAGFIGIVSRILWGWATDRWANPLLPLRAVIAGSAFAITLLLIATPDTRWVAAIGAVLGATFLVWIVLVNVSMVRYGEAQESTAATGAIYAAFFAGMLVSPMLFGWVIDSTESYRLAWGISAAMMVGALAAVPAGRAYRGSEQ